jgi:hypothetical protein
VRPVARAARRQRGAAMVEFSVIAILAFFPLVMAILQLGLFMVAKNTVNTTALNVARAGGATGGDKAAMQRAFASGVAPLYASSGLAKIGASKEVTAGNYPVVYGTAMGLALLEMKAPYNTITILSPRQAAFHDFGLNKPGVGVVIPHTNLDDENGKVGAASGQTRSDALLLKVEVKFCYEMIIPVIDVIISKAITFDPLNAACYLPNKLYNKGRGIPIVSQAVVRMTVSPPAKNFP